MIHVPLEQTGTPLSPGPTAFYIAVDNNALYEPENSSRIQGLKLGIEEIQCVERRT